MGVVYEAFDSGIGRPVAIKVIRVDPETTADLGAELRHRLIREASAAGRLSHPNIVTVYQLGEDGADVFVVMEFVSGDTLQNVLRARGKYSPAEATGILKQAAEGLDYAHRAGVIHRDIKPANILIREDGGVKIADFGIAKMVKTATEVRTSAGVSLGSPSYMSPEQVRADQLDGQSDQFSLAITAYQMMTGHLPFQGDTAHAIMFKIASPEPFVAESDLPSHVREALQRALSKDPKDRFPTCAAFVQALEAPAETVLPPQARVPGPSAAGPVLNDATVIAAAPPARARQSWVLPAVGVLLAGLLALGYFALRDKRRTTDPAAGHATEQPLVKAIEAGQLETAKSLLAHGADVNARNPDGTTALMAAAEGNAYLTDNATAVQTLLDKGANVDLQDSRGRTALFRAVSSGKDDAVKLLLAHKANPDQKEVGGTTPLLEALTYGRTAAIDLLLASGASVEAADDTGLTPLMHAAEGTVGIPFNEPTVKMLLEKGAKVETQDKNGRTALHRAALDGKLEAAQVLLDNKANVNARANDGRTPLLNAVETGREPLVNLLIDRGADIELADVHGITPLMIASEGTAYFPNNAPFVSILLRAKAKPDVKDENGRTAIFKAAAEGKDEAVKLLLDAKANPNLQSQNGASPLEMAIQYNHQSTAEVLLSHGADPNLADASGTTSLMLAAEVSPYNKTPAELVKLLLSHGAKTNLTDAQGRTALARAKATNTAEAVELLTGK